MTAMANKRVSVRGASAHRHRVVWEPSFPIQPMSLALVDREMCRALLRTGLVDLHIRAGAEDSHFDSKQAHSSTSDRSSSVRVGVHVRNTWPPILTRPASDDVWVWLQPWGFGAVPPEWIEVMNWSVDEVWVPTRYDERLFTERGVRAERIHVVPHGVDPTVFNPAAAPLSLKTRAAFRFLYVGGAMWRKGPDVMLKAYERAFRKEDGTCLVVKDYGGKELPPLRDAVSKIQSDPTAPEILYIDNYLDDNAMAGLYTACDAFVHPYRVEGFSLPIVEAMACGLPVIVPNHGVCLQYCDAASARLLPVDVRTSNDVSFGDLVVQGPTVWAEVDPADLVIAMQDTVLSEGHSKELAAHALRRVQSDFTWSVAASIALLRIQSLIARS